MISNLGFMQGRLIKDENGTIQSFPSNNWKKEFLKAKTLGLKNMEWTIDRKNILKNPIFTKSGIKIINEYKSKYLININSATCDFFMQKPFFKIKNKNNQKKELNLINKLIYWSNKIGIKYFIFPLVDNASLKDENEERYLVQKLRLFSKKLIKNKQMILFESDYEPYRLNKFIQKFSRKCFGINYDLGNSASLGYKLKDEKIYFKYVKNIHIKDRKFNGETVRLGRGDVKFKQFINFIKRIKFNGNFILQTARGKDDFKEYKTNLKFLKKLF